MPTQLAVKGCTWRTSESCSSSPVRCSAEARSGSTPTSSTPSPGEIAEVATVGRPDRDRRRRRQLLPRRRAPAARHGPRPRRLHGHARHRHELPGAPGLPREARRRDARADRHHDGPGRRALHPAPRHPAHGEGPGRDLRRRRRPAVLLHRHRRRPARAGDQVRGRADGQERRRRRLRRRPAAPTPTR